MGQALTRYLYFDCICPKLFLLASPEELDSARLLCGPAQTTHATNLPKRFWSKCRAPIARCPALLGQVFSPSAMITLTTAFALPPVEDLCITTTRQRLPMRVEGLTPSWASLAVNS